MKVKTHATLALALIGLASAAPARAQIVTGGAGNTGVPAPSRTGGVEAGTVGTGTTRDSLLPPAPAGNAASRSNAPVPGTTPGVNIGGTPTSGPPGTGGAAGGPSLNVR